MRSVLATLLAAFAFAALANAQADELSIGEGEGKGKWAATVFLGILSEGELADIIIPDPNVGFEDTGFVGFALSREIARWHGFSIELEGGLGGQFGDNATGQVWAASYLRYDRFPWDDYIHTSIAASVGVNYAFRNTAFEIAETTEGSAKKLLHYFSPEVTFALPDRKENELVFRVHHRSSFAGAFGCDGCGSNVVTVGFRKRF